MNRFRLLLITFIVLYTLPCCAQVIKSKDGISFGERDEFISGYIKGADNNIMKINGLEMVTNKHCACICDNRIPTINSWEIKEATKCNQDFFNDNLLDKLTGHWMATGKVGEDKVDYSFSVQWVLNHQFLEMTFADTATKPLYTAKVFIGYDCQKEKYVIHWMDNFGGAFSETLGYGVKKDQSIEMSFEYPAGHLLNTFSFDEKNNQWTSHSVTKDETGNWVTFGHILLHRAN